MDWTILLFEMGTWWLTGRARFKRGTGGDREGSGGADLGKKMDWGSKGGGTRGKDDVQGDNSISQCLRWLHGVWTSIWRSTLKWDIAHGTLKSNGSSCREVGDMRDYCRC